MVGGRYSSGYPKQLLEFNKQKTEENMDLRNRIALLEEALKKADESLRGYAVNYEYYQNELAGSWKEIYDEARETRVQIKEILNKVE